MNYVIRKATNEDVSKIAKLIFHIWTKEYNFKVSPKNYPDLQDIEQHYHQKNDTFLVAALDEKIIGTIACSQLEKNIFVLKRMFVQSNVRRKGVAQALLNRLLKVYLPEAIFYLSTKEGLAIAAKKFYLKNRFEVISKNDLPNNFPIFYEDNLFMRKINE